MKKITTAVVGLGYWGPNLVRNFTTLPQVEVTWLCDKSESRLTEASRSFPWTKRTSDIHELLTDRELDLIAIATPLETHYSLAKMVLSSGKHVLIEKPMTQSSKQAESLIELSQMTNKKLFVGHTFIYSEPIRKLKKLIEKNQLGKIFYYDSTRINLGLLQSDTNVLWDLAPHDLSIIKFLFHQNVKSVQAIGSSFLRKNIEELVHLFLELEDSISCHVTLSWLSPVKVRKITIAGSSKMATLDDIEPVEKIKIYDKGVSIEKNSVTPFFPAYRSGDITIPQIVQKEALQTELKHFVSCIRNNTNSLSGGNEGLEIVKLLEALEKSLRTGKKVYL